MASIKGALSHKNLVFGVIAIFLYPTIIAIVRHRKPTLQDEDYFDHLEQDSPMMAPEPHEIVEERDDGREQ